MTTYRITNSTKVFRFLDWGELTVSWWSAGVPELWSAGVPAFWSLADLTSSFTAFLHCTLCSSSQALLACSEIFFRVQWGGGSGKVWRTISADVGQTSTRLGLCPPSRGTTHQNCAFSQEETRICRRKKVSGGFYQIIILLRKFSFWP